MKLLMVSFNHCPAKKYAGLSPKLKELGADNEGSSADCVSQNLKEVLMIAYHRIYEN